MADFFGKKRIAELEDEKRALQEKVSQLELAVKESEDRYKNENSQLKARADCLQARVEAFYNDRAALTALMDSKGDNTYNFPARYFSKLREKLSPAQVKVAAEAFAQILAQVLEERESSLDFLFEQLMTDPRYVHVSYGVAPGSCYSIFKPKGDMRFHPGLRYDELICKDGIPSDVMHHGHGDGWYAIRGRKIGPSYGIYRKIRGSEAGGRSFYATYMLLIPEDKIEEVVPILAENPELVACISEWQFPYPYNGVRREEELQHAKLNKDYLKGMRERLNRNNEGDRIIFKDLP